MSLPMNCSAPATNSLLRLATGSLEIAPNACAGRAGKIEGWQSQSPAVLKRVPTA